MREDLDMACCDLQIKSNILVCFWDGVVSRVSGLLRSGLALEVFFLSLQSALTSLSFKLVCGMQLVGAFGVEVNLYGLGCPNCW